MDDGIGFDEQMRFWADWVSLLFSGYPDVRDISRGGSILVVFELFVIALSYRRVSIKIGASH